MNVAIWTVGLVAACAVAVGCGSAPVPEARVASTETAVQSARQAGADRVPAAKTHLDTAQDGLSKAKNQINEGNNAEAETLLTRAQADASLAAALSREARQKAATDMVVQRVHSTATQMQQPSSR